MKAAPAALSLILAALLAVAAPALAADHLRIGKPEARAFDFAPVEIGSNAGIFAKYGIEAESIDFGGGARGATIRLISFRKANDKKMKL